MHHCNSTQYCNTETVFIIFPFLQTNITSQMWPTGGKGEALTAGMEHLQGMEKDWLTKERSNEECRERHIDDRWDHVDEPVRQERSDAQEHDVVEQVFTMSFNLPPQNTDITTLSPTYAATTHSKSTNTQPHHPQHLINCFLLQGLLPIQKISHKFVLNFCIILLRDNQVNHGGHSRSFKITHV